MLLTPVLRRQRQGQRQVDLGTYCPAQSNQVPGWEETLPQQTRWTPHEGQLRLTAGLHIQTLASEFTLAPTHAHSHWHPHSQANPWTPKDIPSVVCLWPWRQAVMSAGLRLWGWSCNTLWRKCKNMLLFCEVAQAGLVVICLSFLSVGLHHSQRDAAILEFLFSSL